MNFQGLLYELRHNILHDRSDAVPGAATDQLWSDQTLLNYIKQAQDEVAAKTLCLRDATNPDCCIVQLVPGQEFYPLHPKVLAILSARRDGDVADLARAGHAALNSYIEPDSYFLNPQYLSTLPAGRIKAYTTDEGQTEDDHGSLTVTTFRAYPVPDVNENGIVRLRVARLPINEPRLDNLLTRPEVPERWHMKMLDWAGYLALRAPDLDVAGGDAILRARDLKSTFMETITEATSETKRKMFTPAVWSFGRNGFSYERD